MAQLENGYTRIANEILENLASIRISGEAMQVLLVIIRKTYGFRKKSDTIALAQFSKLTGLNKPAVCRAVKKLEQMGIIIIKKDNVINNDNRMASEYAINKDFEKWEPLSKKITLSKKIKNVIKKDNLPLSILIPSKEINIKKIKKVVIEEKKSEIEIPESLNCSDFLQTWEMWKKHRKEKKAPLKETTMAAQLKRFEKEGIDRSIEAMTISMENGWQGLFWDKVKSQKEDFATESYCDEAILEAIEAECWLKDPEGMRRQEQELAEATKRAREARDKQQEELKKLKKALE
jgi:phage replication O-like protein O